jgi:hypothetical protein
MKWLMLLPAILFFFSFSNSANNSTKLPEPMSFSKDELDSNIGEHKLDGLINDWPTGKFSTDPQTAIQYGIDNNTENLYLVLNIADPGTQTKIMRRGMNLFIDLKGKKKEGRGVEFPLKTENGDMNDEASQQAMRPAPQGNEPTTDRQKNFDKKKMRMMMAINLVYLRYFGFGEGGPVLQDLKVQGSISAAFAWDSTDEMHIEYVVPLKMLGDIPSLNEKNISVGWKINAVERQTGRKGAELEGGRSGEGGYRGGHSGGRGYGGSRSFGGGEMTPADREKMMKAQSFWTNYTLNIPAAQ